ncbi:hypothetical protein TI05_08230 [Achromatium sp. WMS3]|nr:hypothetical protein TI05_08230 [Achromatium sp. WMS3]
MTQRIALVTGANRGLGFEICRQLAQQGIQVILTARNYNKGKMAAHALVQQGYAVYVQQVDITQPTQIQTLLNYIKTKFNRLDILINNAGIYIDQQQPALSITSHNILQAVETDVCGTFAMSQAVIPLMQKHNYGRIVNISSTSSLLANMNDDVGLAYKICKTSINAITVVLANAVADYNILINAATPGWIKTDMGGEQAPLSVQTGADTPVWLATLPDDGPNGGLFCQRQRLSW